MGQPTLYTSLRPIAANQWDRAYLPGAVLRCHCSRRWRLSGEGKLPRHRYLMKSLSVLIPALLIITHGKSPLPDCAFSLAES
jgi:hypothetical protein